MKGLILNKLLYHSYSLSTALPGIGTEGFRKKNNESAFRASDYIVTSTEFPEEVITSSKEQYNVVQTHFFVNSHLLCMISHKTTKITNSTTKLDIVNLLTAFYSPPFPSRGLEMSKLFMDLINMLG